MFSRHTSQAGSPHPRLLVSVASAAEVPAALEGGADIIDAKDPTVGAMGRVTPQTLSDVIDCVRGAVPVTAAMGELADFAPLPATERKSLRGVTVVKFGSARLGQSLDIAPPSETIWGSLPEGGKLAIVHYADWQAAGACDFEATLHLALRLRASAVVLDTFQKQHGCLLDFYSAATLRAMVERLARRGLAAVAAGSLGVGQVADVVASGASVFAVRGSACSGRRREGTVDRAQVRRLRLALTSFASGLSSPQSAAISG